MPLIQFLFGVLVTAIGLTLTKLEPDVKMESTWSGIMVSYIIIYSLAVSLVSAGGYLIIKSFVW